MKLMAPPSAVKSDGQSGFSMIEVIVVVALIAFIYSIAIPQLNLRTGVEASTVLTRIASDIRSAFDMAVLTGRPHRLVFRLATGEYWLESTEAEEFYLGQDKLDHDPTEAEEKSLEDQFLSEFAGYEELVGDSFTNPADETQQIAQLSPLIKAKDRLKATKWSKVSSLEWEGRNLGGFYRIYSMQAEHHGRKQEIQELGEEGRVFLYFFPSGYVQKAVIHIGAWDGEQVDESQKPYTLVTDPFEGTAEIIPDYREIDVHADDEANG